jgi:hypothetical protein
VDAVSVTSEAALGALLALLSTQWQDVTTVTTPVGSHIRKVLKSMRNAMVELGFVRIGLRI